MPPKGRKSLEPWLKDEVDFYQHQIDGVRELVKRRSFILGDDMGLGKSLEALAVFCVDIDRGWASTALVISPKSLKWNWVDEIHKFTRIPFVALDGTPSERTRQLMEFLIVSGPKILLITYEEAYLHREELANMPFDVAVFDEAHYIKNPLARRTKAVLELRSRRSFMLTGTPLLNRIDELWCLLHRIDPIKYANYYAFVNRYAVFGGFKGKAVIGVKNEKELKQRVQGIMLRRKKEDVLDLPPVQYIQRRIGMHPEQEELYKMVNDELRLVRYDEVEDEEIDNALTKFLRLKQICGTIRPFTGIDVSAKLDLAVEDDMELVENDHKTVTFTQFHEVRLCYLDRIRDRVGKHVPVFTFEGATPSRERQEIVRRWSAVKGAAVLVPMLQVASEGINLTAARHAGFLDKWFTPGKNQQAVDRLHRIGADETQPVQIREYVTRRSVELRIEQINRDKKKIVDMIVNSGQRDRKLLKLIMEEEAYDEE